mgnify:CR=1 FL=1
MSQSYEDIIDLPHPTSVRHPRMPRISRAAQFSPFAALTGHEAAITETARLTEQKMELTEEAKAELDRKQKLLLEHMAEQPEVTVTWFQPDGRKEGGKYITAAVLLKKIDTVERILYLTNGDRISLDDVIEIQTEWI